MKQAQVIISGLSINYYLSDNSSGEEVLVMLHGWGSGSDVFKPILSQFPNSLALDLPGFGQSQTPLKPWKLDDYVLFLESFLNKLSITSPILLGHSFGGSIIIKFVTNHNNVKKIILVNSAGVRKKTSKKSLIKTLSPVVNTILSVLPHSLKAKIKQELYKKIGAQDYMNAGELKETFKNIVSEDLSGLFEKVKSETLIIWGDQDRDTPLEDAKEMNAKIINSQLVVLNNAGHYSFIDNQKDFIETLSKFLKK